MRSLTYQQSVFKRYHSDKHFSELLPTIKMAAKVNWHRYGTKLRHCHPIDSTKMSSLLLLLIIISVIITIHAK